MLRTEKKEGPAIMPGHLMKTQHHMGMGRKKNEVLEVMNGTWMMEFRKCIVLLDK